MIEQFSQGAVSFVSVRTPTPEDARELIGRFNVSPTLLDDVLTSVPQNYVTHADGTIKLVFDFPVVKRIDIAHPYEVKIFITKKALIVIEYEEMEAIDRFKKEFEVISIVHKKEKRLTSITLFFALMREFYRTTAAKLDYVNSILADIEAEIFNDNEKQMVVDIAKTGKKIIAFRHILWTHEDILTTLRPLLLTVLKGKQNGEFDDLMQTYLLLLNRTNTAFETLSALRDTNMAMLTAKQNEIIKTLTIMAFITFPLALFSSMFGMNVVSAPIVGKTGDFWIIVGIMLSVTAFFFSFFKYKKWV